MTPMTEQERDTVNLLERVLHENVHADAKVLSVSIEDGDHGLVLWKRDRNPDTFVVHRWATHLTDGEPVKGGAMFYSGGYYDTIEGASEDMRDRA